VAEAAALQRALQQGPAATVELLAEEVVVVLVVSRVLPTQVKVETAQEAKSS